MPPPAPTGPTAQGKKPIPTPRRITPKPTPRRKSARISARASGAAPVLHISTPFATPAPVSASPRVLPVTPRSSGPTPGSVATPSPLFGLSLAEMRIAADAYRAATAMGAGGAWSSPIAATDDNKTTTVKITYRKPPGNVPTINVSEPGKYKRWSTQMKAYLILCGIWSVLMFQFSQLNLDHDDSLFLGHRSARRCEEEFCEIAFSIMTLACNGATTVLLGRFETDRNAAKLWVAIRDYCVRIDPSRLYEVKLKLGKVSIKTDGTLETRIRKYLREIESAIQAIREYDPNYEPGYDNLRQQLLSEIRKIKALDVARVNLEDVTEWHQFTSKLERYAHTLNDYDGTATANKISGQNLVKGPHCPKVGMGRANTATPADWQDKSKPCGLPKHSKHTRANCLVNSMCERCGAIEDHSPQNCTVNPMSQAEKKQFFNKTKEKLKEIRERSSSSKANQSKEVHFKDQETPKASKKQALAAVAAFTAALGMPDSSSTMPNFETPPCQTFAVIDKNDEQYSSLMCFDSGATHVVISKQWASNNPSSVTDMPANSALQYPNTLGAWNGSTAKVKRWVYVTVDIIGADGKVVCPVCLPGLIPDHETTTNLISAEVMVNSLAVQVQHDRNGMRLRFDDGTRLPLQKRNGLYHIQFRPSSPSNYRKEYTDAQVLIANEIPDQAPAPSLQNIADHLADIYGSMYESSKYPLAIIQAKAHTFVNESERMARATKLHGISMNYKYLKAVTGYRNDTIVDYVGRALGIKLTGRDRTAMGMPNAAQRALGASKRHPNPPTPTTPRVPGELVSQDGVKLSFRMIGGYRVIFFTVDRATNRIRCSFAQSKTSVTAARAFEQYFTECGLYESASHGPKIIHTDYDPIYRAKPISDMLRRRNIRQRYSAPLHSRNNWAVEKYIGIIMSEALVMLFSPTLLSLGHERERLYGYAVQHACLLHSIFPTTGNPGNATPHTAETGEDSKPLIPIYCRAPFGSPGYVHSDRDHRGGGQVQFRSRYGLFAGVSPNHNNSLIMYMPDTKRIVITPDVLLNCDPSIFTDVKYLAIDNEIFEPYSEQPPIHAPQPTKSNVLDELSTPVPGITVERANETDADFEQLHSVPPTLPWYSGCGDPVESQEIDATGTEPTDPLIGSGTEGVTAEPLSDNTLQINLPASIATAAWAQPAFLTKPPFPAPSLDFFPDPAISIYTCLGTDAAGVEMNGVDAMDFERALYGLTDFEPDFENNESEPNSATDCANENEQVPTETTVTKITPKYWDSDVARAYATIIKECQSDEPLITPRPGCSLNKNNWVDVDIDSSELPDSDCVSIRLISENTYKLTCQINQVTPDITPSTYRESQNPKLVPDPQTRKSWHDCTVDEMTGIEAICEPIDPKEVPPECKVINTRIIYRVKYDSNGKIVKFKARCVAQGFHQRKWFEYGNNSSSVPSFCTCKMFFGHVCINDYDCIQVDFTQAFLGADLDTEIYVKFGIDVPGKLRGRTAKLNGSLYGLKQANKCFVDKRNHCIIDDIGGTQSNTDPNLFTVEYPDGHRILLLCYIDDVAIASTKGKPHVEEVLNHLRSKFTVTGGEDIEWYLNMKIERDRVKGTLRLSQKAYIDNLLESFFEVSPDQIKHRDTPWDPNYYPTKQDCPITDENVAEMKSDAPKYRSTAASLRWYLHTRPDIHFNVTQLCRFISNPGRQHWKDLKSVLRYCAGTRSRGITFDSRKSGAATLFAHCDSDWGKCKDTRRSVTGYSVEYCGGPVIAKSQIQKLTAMSTCEAELIALTTASLTLVWCRRLLAEMTNSKLISPSKIYCDNQSAIAVSESEMINWANRHIPLRYFKVRELIRDRLVEVEYIRSQDNHSDMMTKQLPKVTLLQHSMHYAT